MSRVSSSRGMALIMVLSIVAALSIVATGLLTTIKGEIRLVGHQKRMLVAGALADAAIRRVLQDITALRPVVVRNIYIDEPISGQNVSVVIKPLGGLIDINQAPESLLVFLFQHAAKQAADRSALLARAVVDARTRPDSQGRPQGFDAPEDLLQVPGIDYPLYATIADLISADLGSSRVNPHAAKPEVLTVLLGGNAALASQLASVRDRSPLLMDTSQFNPAFIDTSPATAVQVVARVSLADGATLVRTWFVNLAPSLQTGLPWQTLGTTRHVEPVSSDN